MCLAEAKRVQERGVKEKRVKNLVQSRRDGNGKNMCGEQDKSLIAEYLTCRNQEIARTSI